jgi:hypothetical protein
VSKRASAANRTAVSTRRFGTVVITIRENGDVGRPPAAVASVAMDIGAPETEHEIEIAPLEEPVPTPAPAEAPAEEPVPA